MESVVEADDDDEGGTGLGSSTTIMAKQEGDWERRRRG